MRKASVLSLSLLTVCILSAAPASAQTIEGQAEAMSTIDQAYQQQQEIMSATMAQSQSQSSSTTTLDGTNKGSDDKGVKYRYEPKDTYSKILGEPPRTFNNIDYPY